MNNFGWDVLDWELPTNFNQSNSRILLCRQFGKDVLILYEDYITLIFEFLSKSYIIKPPCIASVESKQKIINVIHVFDRIFMFDNSGDLLELIENSNKYSWKWVQHLDKGLAVSGLNKGLAFLRQIEKMTFIEFYKLNMDEFELESSKKLNYSDVSTEPFLLTTMKTDDIKFLVKKLFGRADIDEIIFIDDPLGFTYISSINLRPVSINYEKDALINVLSYKNQNSFLLIYQSGKIIHIECIDSVSNHVLFLNQKVFTVTWYDNEKTTLIWSDGIDLHLSKIVSSTEIFELQIQQSIKGVYHLLSFNDKILAITTDNIFYNIGSNEVLSNPIVNKKSGEILKGIYDIGIQIEKLNDDIRWKEDAIYALESSKIEKIGEKFKLTIKGKELNIKNESKRLFKKLLWSIKLEVCDKIKKLVEIKNLENDFNNDMSINIETNLIVHSSLICSLICDIGNNFKLIEINLPKIEMLQQQNENVFDQKLSEIMKNRNENSIIKFK